MWDPRVIWTEATVRLVPNPNHSVPTTPGWSHREPQSGPDYPAGSQQGLVLVSSSLPLQDEAGDSARPAGSTSRSHIGKKVPEACWETLLLDYMKTHIVEDTMEGGLGGRLPCPKLLLWGLLLSSECPGLENRRARSPK